MASILNADTSNGLKITSDTSGEIKLQSAGTDTVTVDTSGNVGIGNSSPMSSESPTLTLGQATVIGDVVSDQSLFGNNIYYNSGWKYYTTADYSAIRLQNQSITFHNGPSASAGSSASNMDTTDIKMMIDPSGRVTTPNQPAFLAYNASSGNPVVWASTTYNIGNHYDTSTGRFTAPISGRYFMYCNIHSSIPDGGVADFRMQINAGDMPGGGANNAAPSYAQATGVAILNLSAGDYVTIRAFANFTNVAALSSFGGYLIG